MGTFREVVARDCFGSALISVLCSLPDLACPEGILSELDRTAAHPKSANTQIKDHDHSQPCPPPYMDAHSVLRDLESLDASRKDVLLALSQPRPIHVIVFLQSGRHFREAMSALKT